MFQKVTTGLGVAFLFSASLLAQKADSLPASASGAVAPPPAAVSDIVISGDTVLESEAARISRKKDSFPLRDLEEASLYDSLWLQELHSSAQRFSEMRSAVQNPPKKDTFRVDLPTDTLKARLALLDAKTPFHISYNPSLERVIKSFLVGKRGLMQRMIAASQFYFPLFEQELNRYGLPLEIKYLAVVESALNPRARSRAGASGLWQFMYSTGKMYGLEVSNYVDERHDPVLATQAACQYLSKLYTIFSDWDLALAAYNSGPGNVSKAIRRSGGYKNYWNIRAFLPRETAGYVPAFLATLYLFEYAEAHGLHPKKATRPYFETDTVHVKHQITFDQIATLINISTEELKALNPAYTLNIIPKIPGKPHALRLPVSKIGTFVNNESAIYAHAQKELEALEKPMPQFVAVKNQIRYRVKSGDYLGKIAARYGVGVRQIQRWNGLRSSRLRVGQRLIIFPKRPYIPKSKGTQTASTSSSRTPSKGAKVHTVQKGDTLWTISKKYPGISVENLREWNGIRGDIVHPGTALKLCACSS